MTWYHVADHKFGCPACEWEQTEVKYCVTRTEVRTRTVDGFVTVESDEEITSSSKEECDNCGRIFDHEEWTFGKCRACGGAGFECEDLAHCTRCLEIEESCECERAECCENFTDDCECKESDVKGKDAKIEKAVQVIENIHYEATEMRLIAKAMFKDPTGSILADIIFPSDLKEHTAPTPDAPTPDPVPDKNRVQTPAVRWALPEDLPEE